MYRLSGGTYASGEFPALAAAAAAAAAASAAAAAAADFFAFPLRSFTLKENMNYYS